MKKQYSYKVLWLLALVLGLWLTACGGSGSSNEEPTAAATTAAETAGEETADTEKPVIKLIVNPWSASELNVEVARIILSEEMGYPVEVISLDEFAQFPALAAGDADASLEVWPSGHQQDIADYIDSGQVENGGLLGPVGKIGWYIPSYMVEQHPELATWEGFQNPANAALFATAETGDKGQFLQGDPSWTYHDEAIINNLGMDLQVVTAGSEQALLSALDGAYSREEPILFYFWTPHSVHSKYELTTVQLPPYSEECYASEAEGGIACDYPSDELFKILSPQLREKAPDVAEFLSNLNYSTEDQIQMIAAVELDGKSVEEAAREWLDGHEDAWRAWIP